MSFRRESTPARLHLAISFHAQIGGIIKDRLDGFPIILRVPPGMQGVDIEMDEQLAFRLGEQYLEIKPLTESGSARLRIDLARWKLPEAVRPVLYDYDGNIFYGPPQ